MPARTRRIGFLAGFFLLALVNCGGGGGGGGDDGGGGGGVVADFTATCLTSDPCFANAVTSQKGTAAGNVVEVQLWLNKLNTAIGAASLDVGFDPTVADYQGFMEGSALGASPQTVYLISESNGEVLVDIAPPAGGKSVSSATIMVTLTFKLLKTTGGSNFIFRNPNTLSGSALYTPGGAIINLGSAGWSGGVFSGL
jgi:hypothetical protein